MPWLPYSNNIEEENIMVPTVVYNSLTCFLSEGGEGEEKKEKVNAKGHCQQLVLSLAQCMYEMECRKHQSMFPYP